MHLPHTDRARHLQVLSHRFADANELKGVGCTHGSIVLITLTLIYLEVNHN